MQWRTCLFLFIATTDPLVLMFTQRQQNSSVCCPPAIPSCFCNLNFLCLNFLKGKLSSVQHAQSLTCMFCWQHHFCKFCRTYLGAKIVSWDLMLLKSTAGRWLLANFLICTQHCIMTWGDNSLSMASCKSVSIWNISLLSED